MPRARRRSRAPRTARAPIAHELAESRRLIEARTGRPVRPPLLPVARRRADRAAAGRRGRVRDGLLRQGRRRPDHARRRRPAPPSRASARTTWSCCRAGAASRSPRCSGGSGRAASAAACGNIRARGRPLGAATRSTGRQSSGARLVPVLPLRDTCLFPGASLSLTVDEPGGAAAVLMAVAHRRRRSSRWPGARATTGPRALHHVGTLALVREHAGPLAPRAAGRARRRLPRAARARDRPRPARGRGVAPGGGRRGRRVGPGRRGARPLPARPPRPAQRSSSPRRRRARRSPGWRWPASTCRSRRACARACSRRAPPSAAAGSAAASRRSSRRSSRSEGDRHCGTTRGRYSSTTRTNDPSARRSWPAPPP